MEKFQFSFTLYWIIVCLNLFDFVGAIAPVRVQTPIGNLDIK